MHAPSMRRDLSALTDVPIYRVNLALPLRGNLFDNVVVVKHEGHCTTRLATGCIAMVSVKAILRQFASVTQALS